MSNKSQLLQRLGNVSLVLGCFFILVLCGCEGSATQTTSGNGLHGILVDGEGKPVPGAHVKAWHVASSPNGLSKNVDAGFADSAVTDSLGHYSIQSLDVGVYNITGESGQGNATLFIPRVRYVDEAVDLGRDTLMPPGAIQGKVVTEGRGLATVFCYVEGSAYIAMTDSAGMFTLRDIPMGVYKLNYSSRGYEPEVDNVVTVVSGKTTSLLPKSMNKYMTLGPTAPTVLSAKYDTLTGRFSMAWNQVRNEKIASYTLEYFPAGHPELAEGSQIPGLTDTIMESYFPRNFFVQVYRPGEDAVPLNFFKLEYLYGKDAELTMEFRIRSVDSAGNISRYRESPIELKMPRPEALDNPVMLELAEGDIETTQCRDTLVFLVGFRKPVSTRYDINWYAGFQKRPVAGSLTGTGPWISGNITPMILQSHPDTVRWSKNDIWANRLVYYSGNDSVNMDTGSVAIDLNLKGWQIKDPRRIDFGVDSNGCFRLHKSYRPKGRPGDPYWWQY